VAVTYQQACELLGAGTVP